MFSAFDKCKTDEKVHIFIKKFELIRKLILYSLSLYKHFSKAGGATGNLLISNVFQQLLQNPDLLRGCQIYDERAAFSFFAFVFSPIKTRKEIIRRSASRVALLILDDLDDRIDQGQFLPDRAVQLSNVADNGICVCSGDARRELVLPLLGCRAVKDDMNGFLGPHRSNTSRPSMIWRKGCPSCEGIRWIGKPPSCGSAPGAEAAQKDLERTKCENSRASAQKMPGVRLFMRMPSI